MLGSGQVSPYGLNISNVISRIAFPFYINGHNFCVYCANVRESWYIVVNMHDGSKTEWYYRYSDYPLHAKISGKGQHWHFYNFKIFSKQRVKYTLMYDLT